MKACLDCLPCLARNAIDLARKSAQGDAALEARIAAEGMRILGHAAEEGYALPPPCYARQLIDNALAMSGGAVPDPWAEEKKASTELALKLLERMGLFTNDKCHNCSQIANANLYAAAARGEDGSIAVMLANDSDEAAPFELSLDGTSIPHSTFSILHSPEAAPAASVRCRITDGDRTDESVPMPSEMTPHSFLVAILTLQ